MLLEQLRRAVSTYRAEQGVCEPGLGLSRQCRQAQWARGPAPLGARSLVVLYTARGLLWDVSVQGVVSGEFRGKHRGGSSALEAPCAGGRALCSSLSCSAGQQGLTKVLGQGWSWRCLSCDPGEAEPWQKRQVRARLAQRWLLKETLVALGLCSSQHVHTCRAGSLVKEVRN